MKQTTRKLLSLLMAFAIMLSLAPTGWAAVGGSDRIELFNQASITIKVEESINFVQYLKEEYKSEQIVWSEGNQGTVVSVDNAGNVRGVSVGTTTVTATLQDGSNKYGDIEVVVTAAQPPVTPVPTRIEVTPSELSLRVNSKTSDTFTASLYDQDGTEMKDANAPEIMLSTTNSSIVLSKSNSTPSNVLQVKSGESVTVSLQNPSSILKKEDAIISVSSNDVPSKTVTVHIEPAEATDTASIILSNTSLSISNTTANNFAPLTAYLHNYDADKVEHYSVHWTTSDPSVAYFNGGSKEITTQFFTNSITSNTSSEVNIYAGTVAGTATITGTLWYGTSNYSQATKVTCTVTVSGSTNTLPLNHSSVAITYLGTPATVYPSYTSWPAGSYQIDWTVTSGTDCVQIKNTESASSPWASTATSTANSNNYGIYINGLKTGNATLLAVLKNVNNVELARANVSVTVGTTGFTVVATDPSNTNAVYINNWTSSSNGYYRSFTVDPRMNGTSILSNSGYTISYVWTLNGYTVQTYTPSTSNSRYYTLYANNLNSYSNTLTCTVYVQTNSTTPSPTNYVYRDSVTWTVYNNYSSQFSVGVTVYDTNSGYSLADTPDEGNTGSIASQIDNWVRTNYYEYWNSNSNYRYYRVRIPGGTAYESGISGNSGTLTSSYSSTWLSYSDLEKVIFTPRSSVSNSSGYYRVSFNFELQLYYNNSVADRTVSGTMTFTVRQDGTATGGDINYSAQLGQDVSLDVSDFEDFWTSRYSSGSLTSVVFSSPSGTPSGTVYNSSRRAVGSTSYYVNPSSSQSSLTGIYFSPSASRAGTVRIPFTATGRTRSSSSSTSTSLRGTIVITYLSAAANKITYSTDSAGRVSLKAQDFIDAYKSAVNTSSTPTNLTIQFQDVPAYGTLTYTGGSRDVRLTSSNVKSYKFSTRTSGTNQIGDVLYSVSGSRNDTISYIGYIGNTATFAGEVTFNAVTAPEDVKISYSCTNANGVALTPSNFTSAHSTMSTASYVILGTPKTGKLNYTGGPVTSAILITSLGSVTYVPGSSVTGTATDSFTFTAYNTSSVKVASGTVTINMNLPAKPTNSSAITNISQFTDVPAAGGTADWYRTPLVYLINKGVINGQGDGKFGPRGEVKYGDALKFIMNAGGYYEDEISGAANWAQNYKNKAVSEGWIDNSVNLTTSIPREKMAELAAKVLGISASTAASPFTDTSNQWVVALYNVSPRILQGSNDLSGNLVFSPNKPLTRDEMVCLVYRMYQYSGK